MAKRETRVEFKLRLQKEGRWQEFLDYRKQLTREGYDDVSATQIARLRFAPGNKVVSEKPEEVLVDSEENNLKEEELIDPSLFDGKSSDAREAAEWVADCIHLDVKPEEAPSKLAWNLLLWVRNPLNECDFWKSIWTKLLPTRSQLEKEEKFSDDGRTVLKLIERIKAAQVSVLQYGPERD